RERYVPCLPAYASSIAGPNVAATGVRGHCGAVGQWGADATAVGEPNGFGAWTTPVRDRSPGIAYSARHPLHVPDVRCVPAAVVADRTADVSLRVLRPTI